MEKQLRCEKTSRESEEMWKLEDQRFDSRKETARREKQMQQERIDKRTSFFAQSKKLEQERFDLDKKYQLDQMDLPGTVDLEYAANYAIEQNKINNCSDTCDKVRGR